MIFNFKDTTDAKTLDGHEVEYFAKAEYETIKETYSFPGGSNIEIGFSGGTVALIHINGWNSACYGTYLYNGYANGNNRQKVANLLASSWFPYELSESEQKIIINNKTSVSVSCIVEVIYGSPCTAKVVENPTTVPTTIPPYTIYGTLSTKPTGTYTGNGDASNFRLVATGGIGDTCIVRSANGVAIVTGGCVAIISGNTSVCDNSATWQNGELGMFSNHPALNASGVAYTYHVV